MYTAVYGTIISIYNRIQYFFNNITKSNERNKNSFGKSPF